ncbi:MAG: hypothetical protein UX80_C0024G0009 [Candidatus Amesbacteria bacterium GW2011_GWA2_47_11b]|uniref:GxxExxY protein n=3 Tax=Candidatus Amesiibacteriota TaxID=1752730 RepID=A0A0G1VI33_9BACT|nr:MAG: hypothetical protein UX42_C0008G0020 [Microgenomates group bacterium GW2011_GWC1_46_20]KKU57143.1 MAG: hypothetical protein UX80_C0024G0009 [Candidatus Amesbacteria bacterium GW2011_GWA2_47_11b]KKU69700.1 MAG: hypothetical protein UX92_C0012G0043 [Candidatus Amesbacteria bacterium GW2011_GWA1_47_20]KKU83303.1 MAG: hypothetical protein UY11_C0023G0021 [Candidatus Amesbacteria bacterium GW2011_GWC2_47_8]
MRPVKAPVLFEDLTYKIIGAAMEVHKILGPIHKETVYQKALEKEFFDRGLKVQREVDLPVKYGDIKVGTYRPDFVVGESVVVEIKALEFLPKKTEVQLSYYLKVTGYKIGLLLNFGAPSLEVRRRIYG